ncbi:Beta-lactamase-related protein [Macrophomina phaseolina MS6]|uniref:Beta-lactamase-related protein n=2 Tax=Macrophomina phaseolina TaxID=35725 RepID=K2S189_MACPH|nr:Beta-lactamase-related protein [Macrophomina phaseolina MS6]KAH7034018.1 beta-lactamase [Macrophomina phaseolina]
MVQVHGICEPRFDDVKELLQSYLNSGEELGASFNVNIDGEDVVDLWGGFADKDKTKEWKEDTITTVWSTSKCITALAALVLIERGLLSPYEKVSKYWPEFAANGKQAIEVRHIMSHTSGISGWATPMTINDVYDIPRSTALLEEQAPFWEPGTASGYHSITMGHLIGELVLRTSGKPLGQFIADEIAAPLGADFQLGVAEKDWPRIAEIIAPPVVDGLRAKMDPAGIPAKTFANPMMDANFANTREWRQAPLGGASGHSSAKGVARIMSVVALGGEVGGVRLLSPKTIDLIFREQSSGTDLAAGLGFRTGIGYGLTGKDTVGGWLPDEDGICYWGGWGGSVAIVDVKRKMTIAFVMNKMENAVFGNDRSKAYVQAVYKALGVEPKAFTGGQLPV